MDLVRGLTPRFWLVAALGTVAALLALGLPTALVPNPVFGRSIPPDAIAYVTWLVSAPLAGLLIATYVVPLPASTGADAPMALSPAPGATAGPADALDNAGSTRTALASIGVFFAIGCPVCNKIVLLALGTSGALSVFAPIQPLIGAASIALLAVTLAWRLRRRAIACAVPTTRG